MLRRRRAAIINKQSIPYGMKKVEYLESSGTQYINTLVLINSSFHAVLEWSKTANTQGYRALIGRDMLPWRWAVWSVCGSTTMRWDYGKEMLEVYEIPFNQKIKIEKNKEENFVDGVLVCKNAVPTSFSTSSTCLLLFSGQSGHQKSVGRVHSFVLSANEKRLFQGIPCISNTGTPCMFDKVSRKNFYNAGTGDFLYPTTSTTYSLRRPQAEYAKMTDRGIRRLYHVPADYEGSLEDYAIQCGYKQLIETESPNEDGKYYDFRWVETDDTLMTEWFEIDPPQEEIFEENLDNPTE